MIQFTFQQNNLAQTTYIKGSFHHYYYFNHMHLFQVAFYGAGVFYALFIDRVILIPFFVIVALYLVASALLPRAKPLSTRKKIMQATWGHPNDPNIITRVVVRT